MKPEEVTLLVVDDNADNREILVRKFGKVGYHMLEAESGRAALELIASEVVDLVILDVMMPGLSGLDVVEQLRAGIATETLPIIMATAKSGTEDIVGALDLGADDYVTKPIDFPVLLARTKALLRKKQRLAGDTSPAPSFGSPNVVAGAVLDGRYHITEKIGAGSFGIVFKAIHLGLERPVAVKVLRFGFPDERDAIRFKREGIASCRVRHPNAIETIDFGTTENGTAFLVMELLHGHPLDEELWEDNIISTDRAIELIVPVCRALAAAHASGIVHRDIKPANIFLHQGPDGVIPKVLDFGIAKILDESATVDSLTMKGELVGTPAFMAPERFKQEPYDGRADVYSIGVLLFRLLAGEYPFPSEDTVAVAMAHMSQEPSPDALRAAGIPDEIERIVMATLRKDPKQRPSAGELANQLANAIGLESKPVAIPQEIPIDDLNASLPTKSIRPTGVQPDDIDDETKTE